MFEKGDKYFNSGDLMKVDKDYYLYFNDRIGDTFRYVLYQLLDKEYYMNLNDRIGYTFMYVIYPLVDKEDYLYFNDRTSDTFRICNISIG